MQYNVGSAAKSTEERDLTIITFWDQIRSDTIICLSQQHFHTHPMVKYKKATNWQSMASADDFNVRGLWNKIWYLK